MPHLRIVSENFMDKREKIKSLVDEEHVVYLGTMGLCLDPVYEGYGIVVLGMGLMYSHEDWNRVYEVWEKATELEMEQLVREYEAGKGEKKESGLARIESYKGEVGTPETLKDLKP